MRRGPWDAPFIVPEGLPSLSADFSPARVRRSRSVARITRIPRWRVWIGRLSLSRPTSPRRLSPRHRLTFPAGRGWENFHLMLRYSTLPAVRGAVALVVVLAIVAGSIGNLAVPARLPRTFAQDGSSGPDTSGPEGPIPTGDVIVLLDESVETA